MTTGHSQSFVLLPTSKMPSVEEFRAAWNELMNDVEAPIEKAWGPESAELEIEGLTTIAALMPAPVPNREAEEAASRSLSSMRAEGFSPAPHAAHLLVVTLSAKESALTRLCGHTRVVAALAKASRASGVYEGSAGATHDPDFYATVVSDSSELPLMVWNGVSIAKTSDTVEILTLGMAQLELPDLLLVAPSGQATEALPFAFNLLNYVVSRGSAIPENETVGRTALEKLPVAYVPSPIDPATRVMRVELPRPKKSWWPFGKN
jgi:hypothetical protein